ncbi:uncharacterized protein LOC143033855 [Oratosquilla oratoria]|uniref:uncharacterized protein LOC143033855 n=1 Tax=Oratosquilla oratoria TaxID=337810 RepID=UPI003F76F102
MASGYGEEKIDMPQPPLPPQRRYSDSRRYSDARRLSHMSHGSRSSGGRRYSVAQEERLDWVDITRKSGMPVLYIFCILTSIGGIVCMGIITRMWAEKEEPSCFLYSQSSSSTQFLHFGSAISNCYWCVYGAIPPVLIATVCFFIYWIKVRDEVNVSFWLFMLIFGMVFATIFILAVAATMAEGMRITCANISHNQANSIGYNCNKKLDVLSSNFYLPIQTSTMKDIAMAMYWTSSVFYFITTCFHIYAYHSKTFEQALSIDLDKRF